MRSNRLEEPSLRRVGIRCAIFSVALVQLAACSSDSGKPSGETGNVTGAIGCDASLSAAAYPVFPSSGGNGTFKVDTAAGCWWSASSSSPSLQITTSPSGTGSANVSYGVLANNSEARISTITVGGHDFNVLQRGIAQTFGDVTLGDEFAPYITVMKQRGITSGCHLAGSGSTVPWLPDYCAGDTLKYYQIATFLVRTLFGEDFQFTSAPRFSDVPTSGSGSEFFKYIQKASDLQIMPGCGNGQFCMEKAVTRGETAVFITRAYELRKTLGLEALRGNVVRYSPIAVSGPTTPYFTDVPATRPDFAYVQRLRQLSVTSGTSTNPPKYSPDDTLTRGQLSVFLVRALILPDILPAPAPPSSAPAATLSVDATRFVAEQNSATWTIGSNPSGLHAYWFGYYRASTSDPWVMDVAGAEVGNNGTYGVTPMSYTYDPFKIWQVGWYERWVRVKDAAGNWVGQASQPVVVQVVAHATDPMEPPPAPLPPSDPPSSQYQGEPTGSTKGSGGLQKPNYLSGSGSGSGGPTTGGDGPPPIGEPTLPSYPNYLHAYLHCDNGCIEPIPVYETVSGYANCTGVRAECYGTAEGPAYVSEIQYYEGDPSRPICDPLVNYCDDAATVKATIARVPATEQFDCSAIIKSCPNQADTAIGYVGRCLPLKHVCKGGEETQIQYRTLDDAPDCLGGFVTCGDGPESMVVASGNCPTLQSTCSSTFCVTATEPMPKDSSVVRVTLESLQRLRSYPYEDPRARCDRKNREQVAQPDTLPAPQYFDATGARMLWNCFSGGTRGVWDSTAGFVWDGIKLSADICQLAAFRIANPAQLAKDKQALYALFNRLEQTAVQVLTGPDGKLISLGGACQRNFDDFLNLSTEQQMAKIEGFGKIACYALGNVLGSVAVGGLAKGVGPGARLAEAARDSGKADELVADFKTALTAAREQSMARQVSSKPIDLPPGTSSDAQLVYKTLAEQTYPGLPQQTFDPAQSADMLEAMFQYAKAKSAILKEPTDPSLSAYWKTATTGGKQAAQILQAVQDYFNVLSWRSQREVFGWKWFGSWFERPSIGPAWLREGQWGNTKFNWVNQQLAAGLPISVNEVARYGAGTCVENAAFGAAVLPRLGFEHVNYVSGATHAWIEFTLPGASKVWALDANGLIDAYIMRSWYPKAAGTTFTVVPITTIKP